MSPGLGFYQDDWHFIYYANRGLAKLWELSAYDNRPFASWPYIAGFATLGFRPFAWQIAGILVRWLTTVAFWLFFRALWPQQSRLAAVPALLFAIYPLYTLQPMAVTYITHWACYLLYALSLWLMVLGIRDPKRLWPLLALSVALDGLQLFTIEYFNGIELLRPVVLWMALAEIGEERRSRLKTAVLGWLPYLLVLLAFIYWRGFIFQSPAQDNNAPTVLRDLASAPLPTLAYLITAVLKDSLLILPGAWADTLAPGLVDLSPAGLAFLALSALSLAGSYVYLVRAQPEPGQNPPLGQMLVLGGLGVLLGPIPAWVTRQPLYDTNPLWNSRLGMASMFGAALVLTVLVEWLVRTHRQRALVYSLLMALAVGHLLRSENNYRHAWETQVGFLHQLAWRAPGIAGGTPIISEGELLPLMGDYPTSFAINMIYKQEQGAERALLWYFPSYGDDKVAEKLATAGQLQETKFSTRFAGDAGNSVAIWFDPTLSHCLHVLTPEDAGSRLYSGFLRGLAQGLTTGRISQETNLNIAFLQDALGAAENWCTYYQQAELAAQDRNWEGVLQLWKSARKAGMAPSYGAEFLPFIRAALATGNPLMAESLTETAARTTSSLAMRQTLCGPWKENAGIDPGIQSKVYELLSCTP